MKRILLVTNWAPAKDRKGWSGIPYSLSQELIKYFEVDEHCMHTLNHNVTWGWQLYQKRIMPDFLAAFMIPYYARRRAKLLQKDIERFKPDVIVITHPSSTAAAADLETDVPVVFYTDCVFSNMWNYYYDYVREQTRKVADDIFRRALMKSARVIVTSDWAKDAAVSDYGYDENRIAVIPFGANIEIDDLHPISHDGINLLFVGVDCKRKGADIAVDCVRELTEMDPGRSYHLDIVGCNSPVEIHDENITVHGFINRNIESERNKIEDLRAKADLFILPTQADCSPIVLCEACAYSLPSITYDTGGISNYVINGYNGYRLKPGSPGREFARQIKDILEDADKLNEMKSNARALYESDLNWTTAGKRIADVINSL